MLMWRGMLLQQMWRCRPITRSRWLKGRLARGVILVCCSFCGPQQAPLTWRLTLILIWG